MGNARGTDEEWAGLDYGRAVGPRLDGLCRNRAVPDGIRIRLLTWNRFILWQRDLPEAVLDAAVDHPDRNVRGFLAETRVQRGMSAERWSRLLLAEGGRRQALVMAAVQGGARLTDPAYEALAADRSDAVREETLGLPHLPVRLRVALTADPAASVRSAACAVAWPHLDAGTRARLAADPVERVRRAAALAGHEEVPLTAELFEALGADTDTADMDTAGTYRLERSLAARLAAHEDARVRRHLAGNPYLDPDLVAALATDPDDAVRLAVSLRPELTEEQRAAVRVDIDPRRMRHPVPWVVALHEDEAAMRGLAPCSATWTPPRTPPATRRCRSPSWSGWPTPPGREAQPSWYPYGRVMISIP